MCWGDSFEIPCRPFHRGAHFQNCKKPIFSISICLTAAPSLLSFWITLKVRVLKGSAVNCMLCSPSLLGLFLQCMVKLHRERRSKSYFVNITACCEKSPTLAECAVGTQHLQDKAGPLFHKPTGNLLLRCL